MRIPPSNMEAIRATLREAASGACRLSGVHLKNWRRRCAEAGETELVEWIDREVARR